MRDFGSIVKDKGIPWVRHWIDATFEFSKNFVKSGTTEIDFEALGREEWEFRKALKTKDFSKNERAKYLWNEALNIHNRNANNGKKSPGRPKESPQDAPNGNAGVDMSDAGNGAASKSPTSCDIYEQAGNPLTRESETRGPQTDNNSEAVKALADGDIREDSQDRKSGTSANNYGDAATREGADASTTVSRNMRRVPQNEAPAHGFSGGRTAQGTMSRSPEAAAQSGKAYDQETDQVSTNAGEASSREAEDESATFSGADFTARQRRQVSATADALVNQTRAGAGAQALESPSSLPSPVRNLPRNKEEVRLFAIDNGLDVDDANDWAEMNLRERHGRDKDGKPIRNWKGAIRNYCKAMAAKRETA